MSKTTITRDDFLQDRQGRTFADVLNDPEQPFDEVLAFFSDKDRQRRMEDAEIHHDRAPLAGVIREFESQPEIHRFLSEIHPRRSQRLRQAIGVVVRMVMDRRGWKKTGKKGSLGVRAEKSKKAPVHNTGGLALWFVRAERYQHPDHALYRTVSERCRELEGNDPRKRALRMQRDEAKSFGGRQRNTSSVTMTDEGYACRFSVDGLEVADKILAQLSRAFVFQTSEPTSPGYGSGPCVFRVAYGSQMSQQSLVRLVSSLPGLRLQVVVPPSSPARGTSA